MESRQPMRFGGPANQVHTGFIRCAPAFPMVAAEASRDDVVPSLLSAECDRYHVIECKIFRWKFLSTVLTRVIVACVDIGSRKLHAIVILHTDILQQTND